MFLEAKQIGGGRREVGEASRCRLLEAEFAAGNVVVEDQGYRVERVRGLGLERAVLVLRRLLGLLVEFVHFIGVAVVGSDQRDAAHGVDYRQDARESQINRFDRDRRRPEVAGVTDHVAVGKVATQGFVLAALQRGDHGVGNFGRLHPRTLLEGNDVARYFLIGFAVELAGAVAVPEVGDVTEFLRFGAGELRDAGL